MLPLRATARPRPQAFFQLPAEARTLVYRQHFQRFHATPARRFDGSTVVDAAIKVPHTMLEALHFTGLPWFAVIPLGAIVIRGLFIYPFISLPARNAQQRRLDIVPFLQAWSVQQANHIRRFHPDQSPLWRMREARKRLDAKRRELQGTYRCGFFRRGLSFWQLPIWLTFAECIRRMAGARAGLLQSLSDWLFPRYGSLSEADQVSAVAEFRKALIEPSLCTEGALWFPNLAAADPTFALPCMVSAVTFLNIYLSSGRAKGAAQSPAQAVLRRILLVGALAIAPLTLQVPSAVMLYWLSSSTCAMAANAWLDRVHPLKAPPKACKTPLAAS